LARRPSLTGLARVGRETLRVGTEGWGSAGAEQKDDPRHPKVPGTAPRLPLTIRRAEVKNAPASSCRAWATSFRNGGRHHLGIPGGIIPVSPGDFVGIRIHDEHKALSLRLIELLPRIRAAATQLAREYIPQLEYTSEQYSQDLKVHLGPFFQAIPPFETDGDLRFRRPTELSTILNVGWFVAAFALDKLNIKIGKREPNRGELLVALDELILKAIELSEIRKQWTEP
jgi:hypothetical protein